MKRSGKISVGYQCDVTLPSSHIKEMEVTTYCIYPRNIRSSGKKKQSLKRRLDKTVARRGILPLPHQKITTFHYIYIKRKQKEED